MYCNTYKKKKTVAWRILENLHTNYNHPQFLDFAIVSAHTTVSVYLNLNLLYVIN